MLKTGNLPLKVTIAAKESREESGGGWRSQLTAPKYHWSVVRRFLSLLDLAGFSKSLVELLDWNLT